MERVKSTRVLRTVLLTCTTLVNLKIKVIADTSDRLKISKSYSCEQRPSHVLRATPLKPPGVLPAHTTNEYKYYTNNRPYGQKSVQIRS